MVVDRVVIVGKRKVNRVGLVLADCQHARPGISTSSFINVISVIGKLTNKYFELGVWLQR